MKYLVMECHEGYAVLMDEASCVVRAANLHYTVGQTVTDPILMKEESEGAIVRRPVIMRIAAAAACAAVIVLGGSVYYSRNMKTSSVMTMDGYVKIEMSLNSRGKVISLKSDSPDGKELLSKYNGKNKDSIEAVNDLLQLQKEQGYISDGDSVKLYISSDDTETYTNYKKELEQEISELMLDVRIRSGEAADHEKEDGAEPPVQPVEPPKDEIEPPKPAEDAAEKPVPPEVKPDDEKPAVPHDEGNVKPPEPPVPPADGAAEKPDEPEKPGELKPPVPVEPPAGEPGAEPPAPPHDEPVPPGEAQEHPAGEVPPLIQPKSAEKDMPHMLP